MSSRKDLMNPVIPVRQHAGLNEAQTVMQTGLVVGPPLRMALYEPLMADVSA